MLSEDQDTYSDGKSGDHSLSLRLTITEFYRQEAAETIARREAAAAAAVARAQQQQVSKPPNSAASREDSEEEEEELENGDDDDEIVALSQEQRQVLAQAGRQQDGPGQGAASILEELTSEEIDELLNGSLLDEPLFSELQRSAAQQPHAERVPAARAAAGSAASISARTGSRSIQNPAQIILNPKSSSSRSDHAAGTAATPPARIAKKRKAPATAGAADNDPQDPSAQPSRRRSAPASSGMEVKPKNEPVSSFAAAASRGQGAAAAQGMFFVFSPSTAQNNVTGITEMQFMGGEFEMDDDLALRCMGERSGGASSSKRRRTV
jgi:hypothetical protein